MARLCVSSCQETRATSGSPSRHCSGALRAQRLSVTELYLATVAARNCVQMQLIIVVQGAAIMVGLVAGSKAEDF